MVTAPDILEVAHISCYIDCIGEDNSQKACLTNCKKRILGDNGFWCNNQYLLPIVIITGYVAQEFYSTTKSPKESLCDLTHAN